MPDVGNIKGNSWKVTIGGSEAAMMANVTLAGGYTLKPIRTQKTGQDIVTQLIEGRRVDMTFEFQEDDASVMQLGLGLSAPGDVLDVGAQMPVSSVLLHPAQLPDVTETHDLFIYEMSFGSIERGTNGQGEAIWKVTGTAQRTTAGKFIRQGPAAP